MESRDHIRIVDHGHNARAPTGDYLTVNKYRPTMAPDGSDAGKAGKNGRMDQVPGVILSAEGSCRRCNELAVDIGRPVTALTASPVRA